MESQKKRSKELARQLAINEQTGFFRIVPVRMVIPVLLAIFFFMFTVFSFLLPYFQNALTDKKREMIRELVSTVQDSVAEYQAREVSGELTHLQAQKLALDYIRGIHYGTEKENYFWVLESGENSKILLHPISDVQGADSSKITEPIADGRAVFQEMIDLVHQSGKGYLTYLWPDPKNTDLISPQIVYVQEFQPWRWIIGTGIAFDDIYAEITQMTQKLTMTVFVILALIIGLLGYNIWAGLRSEKKRVSAEVSLQESEEQLRTLVENVPVGIYRNIDDPLDGELQMVNPSFLKMFGFSSETEAKEKKLSELFLKTEEKTLFLQALAKEGKLLDFEVKMKYTRNLEKDLWVSWSLRRTQLSDGTFIFDGILEDVTERRKAADILKESYEKLKALDKEKDEFIATASHEMRTPMGIISGYADLLLGKMGEGMSVVQKGFLEKIQKNVKHLLLLVNEMLNIQRMESGAVEFKREEVSLDAVSKTIVEEFQNSASNKKIKLVYEAEKDFPVMANEGKLREVYTNLLGNAIKFTPEGGMVTVSAKTYDKDPQFVRVSVKDTGIGIPAEELGPIFEKFHQVGGAFQRESEGTGLGLAICKTIVEKNFGGQIWAESENGKGSEFIFLLQLKK